MSDLKIEKSDFNNEHSITSRDILLCSDTGRVIAAFYNCYDLNAVVSMQARIKDLESTPTGKAPCVKFCEATAFRSEIAKKDRRIAELEDLSRAAKKFIDSHIADPDLTNEMIDNYEAYSDLSSQVIIYDK